MACFPPSLELSNIIHNLIFYSNQIYWVEFLYPGVGLRPPMVIPYGITVGADTIHPEFNQTDSRRQIARGAGKQQA